MTSLVLYTTLGCHLCEQALALITPVIPADCDITSIDISDSDSLMECYGIRIPVIARTDNHQELGWPFDQQQFLSFLE